MADANRAGMATPFRFEGYDYVIVRGVDGLHFVRHLEHGPDVGAFKIVDGRALPEHGFDDRIGPARLARLAQAFAERPQVGS